MNIKSLFAVALLSGAILQPLPSHAATRQWGTAQSGPFDGAGNQWNVLPGSGDIARFSGYADSSAFTVTLTQDVINQYIRLDGAGSFAVTLDLAGHTYTASTTGSVVGRDGGDRNTLIVKGGGTFTAIDFTVGNAATSSGTLAISNGSNLQTSDETVIGNSGTGLLKIIDGGSYTSTGIVRVGKRDGGSGSVTISGSGSQWSAAKEVFFGSASGANGSLTIEMGAKMATTTPGTDGSINFAQAAGSTVNALVTGEGSELSSSSGINIGGARSGPGGEAHVTVADQAILKAVSALNIDATGTLTLAGGTATARDIGTSDRQVKGAITLEVGNPSSLASLRASRDIFLDATSAKLILTLPDGATFADGDLIRLIDYKGTLTGTFSNYSEGQILALGDYQFAFSYVMGGDSDHFIGLRAIPEPGASAFLTFGGALAGIIGLRKFQKH